MRRKLFLTVLSLLAIHAVGHAADSLSIVDHAFFNARAGLHAEAGGEEAATLKFKGDYLNFDIGGHISPTVSYRIRQRLVGKAYDPNDIFKATDFLYLDWKISDKWLLTFGKQVIDVGGFEYDANPIDVYYYGKYCNSLDVVYAFGVKGTYTIAPGQDLSAEFCESPFSAGHSNYFAYNLLWRGHFFPWWETVWSVNLIDNYNFVSGVGEYKTRIGYLALGNRWYIGNVQLDLDLMTREWHPFSDMSAICKVIWSVGDWNICSKFGYECNDAENVDKYGLSYDKAVLAGSEFGYFGCGAEYFPRLKGRPLRLHAAWWWNTDGDNRHFLDAGITWYMRIK